ncbi:hypothetical protein [Sporanaerobacter acetigenes]|uniref:Uncharacterized protein n=1 Tax=Sporanaerobacter acetigenes DSM 13106 TaxID=1123281 RepID=A0A1M5XTE9_9FIRM|nr:hypothetical protein [Sporanaerobacter acetigenes]SHI03105.1 hypothetical protein SAMN02745180_01811 [Sporanaerobacter acetigenes DSM 13106]
MATSTVNLWKMYEGLKYNFLFNNDINSIHILLNLYDLEENINNICPKYTCIKDVKRGIKYLLRYREDKDLVTNKIVYLIHEDVDRLELCFYLEGYKYGYYNNKWVNILEEKTLNYYTIEEIYNKKYLFQYNINVEDIKIIKNKFDLEIDYLEDKCKYIEGLTDYFSDQIIKNKIYKLNDYIDRQLKMDFNSYSSIKEEGSRFSQDELNKLYNLIVKYLYKNVIQIYKNASWYGLNDKVLNRYS